MEMSDGERLIVVMLADVMKALKLNDEIDPDLVQILTINNEGWAIKRKYSFLFSSEAASDDIVSETTNILWMWGIIEHGIRQLKGAEADEASGWHWTSFTGFDANHDDHYNVAYTLIEKLGEFQDFAGRDLNSHSQASLPRYQDMYAKFDRYINAGRAAPLPFDALRDLCN